jgi:tetratricopeptide (TPR) repeat protein
MLRMGEHEAAEEAAREVLALNPDDHRGHAVRGRSLLKLDRPREAVEHLLEALRLKPGDAEIIANLVEAMRVRNPTLRSMLGWLLRKGPSHTVGAALFLFGLFVTIGFTGLWRMSGVFVMACGGLLLLGSFAVKQMTNVLVMLDPLGRRLLTPRERFDAGLLASGLVYAIVFVIAALFIWPGEGVPRTLPLLAFVPAVGNALASEYKLARRLWSAAAALVAIGAAAWMVYYDAITVELRVATVLLLIVIAVLALRWRGPLKLART